MSLPERARELPIDQCHVGVSILAGIIALVISCLAAILALSLLWQAAQWHSLLLCLSFPIFGLVMFAGSCTLRWGEQHLQRLWPSGEQLVLDRQALTLKRRDSVKRQIRWDQPFTALCWRMRQVDRLRTPVRLCLACQLRQEEKIISLYTVAASQDWRRVPSWKQFPLLESPRRPGQWAPPRRPPAPSHRGFSSLASADPALLWPAERQRQYRGLALSFDDFCSVMAVVKFIHSQNTYD